ncbi:uncharacterized protein LOC134231361 isoform X3 [Saccostrea cucullata]|uniref:uncharacterized protein LOC134231361 isoform X3 n=1 Tax=Saccostrea cuccullata TaxID=36930 RepID=UPI002ED1B197
MTMKRRLSMEDSCTELDAMAKRRKISRGKKAGRKHRPHPSIASSQVSFESEQCMSTNTSNCYSEAADKTVTGDFACLQKVCDTETVISEVPVSEPSAADTLCADTLSHIDFLGEFDDLSSVYALSELSPKDPPYDVVMDGSSLYLVGLQNQVYISMVPEPPNSDRQMFCTVKQDTDHFHQHGDNINYLQQSKSFPDKMKERIENWYYATMDVAHGEAHDHQLEFPSHTLEWSEGVTFSHECKWELEYHEPNTMFSF